MRTTKARKLSLGVRIAPETEERLMRVRRDLSPTGIDLSVSDVARRALDLGLDALESKRGTIV